MLAKLGSGRFWAGILGESMNPLGHVMRSPGAILLISCYELGHQPLGLASPMGFLNRAGFAPVGMDIARGSLDEESVRRAKFVGISAPMHTALRLGVQFAKRVRSINPRCHICFYGLYAPLNAEYLLSTCANSIVETLRLAGKGVVQNCPFSIWTVYRVFEGLSGLEFRLVRCRNVYRSAHLRIAACPRASMDYRKRPKPHQPDVIPISQRLCNRIENSHNSIFGISLGCSGR